MSHLVIGILIGIAIGLLGPIGISKLRDLISKA